MLNRMSVGLVAWAQTSLQYIFTKFSFALLSAL